MPVSQNVLHHSQLDHCSLCVAADRQYAELIHGLRHLAAICDAWDTKDTIEEIGKQVHMASAWLLAAGERKPTDALSGKQE